MNISSDIRTGYIVREAAKKNSSTNGQAIKALYPPPSSLMALGTFFFSLKIAENGF